MVERGADSVLPESGRVEGGTVEKYSTWLKESYRPPSRGGNTAALHIHEMLIDGVKYTFYALGTKKWVYLGDTVSFEWELKDGKYHNVKKQTIVTKDKKGQVVVRGDRGFKTKLRSAPSREPVSRREARG